MSLTNFTLERAMAALADANGNRREAAEAVGVSLESFHVYCRKAGRAGLRVPKIRSETGYMPTRIEIRRECAAMRKTWTPYERWRRSGGKDGAHHDHPYETREIATSQIRGALAVSQAVEFD